MTRSPSGRRPLRPVGSAGHVDSSSAQRVAELAARALATENLDEILDDAVQLASDLVDVPLVAMFTLIEEGTRLFWSAGVGWQPGFVRQLSVPADEGSLCSVALADGAMAHSDAFSEESRFEINPVLQAHGAASGMATPLVLHGRPYGTLTVFDTQQRAFGPDDSATLSLIGSIVAAAVARAESEAKLLRQAMHDPLTGLANRALFHDRATGAIRRAAPSSLVAVVLADVDAFKLINDSHGHAVGDDLLAALAPRLTAALPAGATVARLGGDEFVVCVDDVRDAEQAFAIGSHVRNALGGAIVIGGRELFVSASVGVATTGGRKISSGELLRQADVAMYRAKGLGRGQVEIYDRALKQQVADRLALETDLMRGVERQEFSLVYQPVLDLSTGRMAGVEALLRWSRPHLPAVSPATFVPVLEDCGLIGTVGVWVLREAARQMTEWQQMLGEDLRLSVNVSAEQLGRPDLLDAVREVFDEGLAPGTLCLEVTETALVGCAGDARLFLDRLLEAGARIVLDDFGTGYSSLSHLVDFPLHSLKIDRSFVAGLGIHPEHTAVTEAVVALAGRLSLAVVAEGVETTEQLDAVREMGCDYGQGYLWSKPVPAEEIVTIARSGRLAGPGAERRPA